MSIKSDVIAQIQQIAGEHRIELPVLTDDLLLLNSGLDSLAFAVLVARLEDTLGVDPFAVDGFPSVVTLGDFIKFYEESAPRPASDSRQAG